MTKHITILAQQLGKLLMEKNQQLVTAESCTGGGIAYALTTIPGSSNWFERGYITYSNAAKEQSLGVNPSTIETYGAVSAQTANEMAEGALKNSQAQVSIAVTGIAGPGGGTPEKPVGTIWFGWAGYNFATQTRYVNLHGERETIRYQAIAYSLTELIKILNQK